MPPLTSDDALALSKSYRDLSVAIGDFRFRNWNTLSEADRKALEEKEWALLNASSDMVTKAVGLTHLIDLHHVRVLQTRDGFGFGMEAGELLRAGMSPRQNHLQRDPAIQPPLPRLIDNAHASPA